MMIFLIFVQLMRQPRIKLFHCSSLLPVPNNHIMVTIEFLGNFSCSCKRITFHDALLVVVNFWWPATTLLIFKALVSFAELLEPYCTVHSLEGPGPSVLLILLVVSAALWPVLNSNKKITQICFLSNINSLAKDINRSMHLKMMCNITTFI